MDLEGINLSDLTPEEALELDRLNSSLGPGENLSRYDVAKVFDCPEYEKSAMDMVDNFSFWVEGVSQTTVAIAGIIGNILAAVILSRKEMRNAFNLLLVTMACFDSTYLFGSILESFRKQFNLATNLHIILFPYLLYPFNQIAITASIFMTVAIALERFFAVHYPLNYSQAMHEANALTKRIIKYVACVSFLAVLFTATRFFEAKIVYEYPDCNLDYGTTNISACTLNETDDYIVRLEPTEMRTAPIYTAYFNWSRLLVLGIIPFVMLVYLNTKIYQDIKARRNRRLNPKFREQQQKKKKQRGFRVPKIVTNSDKKRNNGNVNENCDDNGDDTHPSIIPDGEETIELNMNSTQVAPPPPKKQPTPGGVTVNESRRKKEDNLAVIFMGFIMVFLICHLPRLLLNIHELVTIQHAMECQGRGFHAFPLWSHIMISLSHLLLVINSATNILIYCCLSSKFREECRRVFRSL